MFAIETKAITKRFGNFQAVSDTSFQVNKGENFGLLGRNGAGKSTLIRMLTTLITPTSGTATVNGWDVRKEADRVRQSVGVVSQAMTSDPDLTAGENLEFSAKLYSVPAANRSELLERALDSVDLADWRDKMVGTFSGGMRRRLEIARSLVHRPQVLFLDEPTTGLDPASRISMWAMIRELKSKSPLTIFLTTHYMEEAEQLCDRVAIFDQGNVVALGSIEELKAELPTMEVIEAEFSSTPTGWLEELKGLVDVEDVRVDDGTFLLASSNRAGSVAALLDAARSHGVALSSLSFKSHNLEDVFIHYTGRSTRDTGSQKHRLDVSHLYQGGQN